MANPEEVVATLQEMGFEESQISRARENEKIASVDEAVQWIVKDIESQSADGKDKNDDELVGAESTPVSEANTEQSGQDEKKATAAVKSMICDDCKKQFGDMSAVEMHIGRTSHQNFSESTEEMKPLTEEEKLARKDKLKEVLEQRRKQREEKEKLEARQKELSRREQGKDVGKLRDKMQQEEMAQLAEERRRERQETALAKKRVLDMIHSDREAMKRRNQPARNQPARNQPAQQAPAAVQQPSPAKSTTSCDAVGCKIQVRQPDGKTLTCEFKVNETLAAVRLFVEVNRSVDFGPVELFRPYPPKAFVDADMEVPLCELGLAPSACLVARPKRPQS